MRPPLVYWSHLKRSFWRSDFLLKYQQNPSRDGAKKKKERKRGIERKASRVSSNKGEVNILRGEKYFNFKNLFNVIPFSPLPLYHFKSPFQNHWESSLNSFWTIL
jgi:hypothetical protein